MLISALESNELSRRPKSAHRENSNPNSQTATPAAVIDSVLDDLVSGLPQDIAETQMIPQLGDRAKEIINLLLTKGEHQLVQRYEDVHRDLADLLNVRRVEDQRRHRIECLTNQISDCRMKLEGEEAALR
jgi:hypothetical protein